MRFGSKSGLGKAGRLSLVVAVPLALLAGERALHGAASQLKVWQDGETLTAKDLNANFNVVGAGMPPKSVIQAWLTSLEVGTYFDTSGLGTSTGPYLGWALCNGKNGTPELSGKFLRINNAAAGATGGSDTLAHTHAIDHDHTSFSTATEAGHTHTLPAHQHGLPFGFDPNNFFLTADSDGLPLYGSTVSQSNHAAVALPAFAVGRTRMAVSDDAGAGPSAAGTPHAHVVDPPSFTGTSGPASATDNRPAYVEMVALMRL